MCVCVHCCCCSHNRTQAGHWRPPAHVRWLPSERRRPDHHGPNHRQCHQAEIKPKTKEQRNCWLLGVSSLSAIIRVSNPVRAPPACILLYSSKRDLLLQTYKVTPLHLASCRQSLMTTSSGACQQYCLDFSCQHVCELNDANVRGRLLPSRSCRTNTRARQLAEYTRMYVCTIPYFKQLGSKHRKERDAGHYLVHSWHSLKRWPVCTPQCRSFLLSPHVYTVRHRHVLRLGQLLAV